MRLLPKNVGRIVEGSIEFGGENLARLNENLVSGVKILAVYDDFSKIKNLAFLDCVLTLEYDRGIPAGGAETDKVSDEDSSDPVTINEEEKKEEQPIHPTGPKPQLGQTGDHLSYIIGYPDGTVQPLGTITRAEVATILVRMADPNARVLFRLG